MFVEYEMMFDFALITLFKGTPLWSGCVTHLKRIFSKTCFFLLSTCVGHNSVSYGTLICPSSVGNSFKTCIKSVDLGKTLPHFSLFNRSIIILKLPHWLRYHKISIDTLNMLVSRKCRFSKKIFFSRVTQLDLSGVPLTKLCGYFLSVKLKAVFKTWTLNNAFVVPKQLLIMCN